MRTLSDSICPICAAAVPAESPGGQCVSCLLQLAIKPRSDSPSLPVAVADGLIKRFGDYELIEELGRGGMGVVWQARQLSLNRPVALKLLLEGRFATEAALKRFEFEAEAAANLEHPNIVPIYEVGQHEGWPYFAMKLIQGADLGKLMTDYALPSRKSQNPSNGVPILNVATAELTRSELRERQLRIAGLIAKTARTLHFAHQRGILHRDLKPSNILLDARGEPHLTDFGLAKRISGGRRLTLTGALLGSPHYMAPEQASASSGNLSTAADVYSLGVVLFELLTGRLPFQADTPVATLRLLTISEPSAPRSINPAIHPNLETICLKCLAKNPSRRYGSAEALAEDLERWTRREPISARPPTPCERLIHRIRLHPVRTALSGIILLALLLTSTFFYASHRTYYWLMAKIADEHLIIGPDSDAVYRIRLRWFHGIRCTYNFWKQPFWHKHNDQKGRYALLAFTNMPPHLVTQLQVRVFSDIPGMADLPKTPVLTNGQVFYLGDSDLRERAFYFGSVNFRGTNVLESAPEASIHVILLGWRGDPDPYQAAGGLNHEEQR